MAVVLNAKGTSVSSFQIGKQGPIVKNDTGVVAIRNKDDASDASLTADSISLGAATGGDQGSGTLNTEALYINGVELGANQATFDSDVFTGTGSQTDFTLSREPISEDAILVAVSGLLQDGGVDYTISGTTLTFTTAPPNTAKVLVLFRDSFGIATLTRDNFTGDGSTTGFTLSQDPGNSNNLLVFIDGVGQYTPDAFSVSGTTLTFTSAPANATDIQTIQLNTGLATVTPGTSTVSFATLDSDMQGTFGNEKNLIINGPMRVVQRNTSQTNIGGGGTSSYHTIDRWFTTRGGINSRYTQTQESTGGPNAEFPYWLKMDTTTAETTVDAGDTCMLLQRMEAQDLQHLFYGDAAAKTLTLSFWFISPKNGIHCVSLVQPDATRNFIREFTISAADTWQYFTVTFPGDIAGTINNDNGNGLEVYFPIIVGSTFQDTADTWNSSVAFATSNQQNLADSTDNNIGLTGVQLELGSTATAFDHKKIREELADCQRYFERVISGSVLVPRVNATSQSILVPYNTTKRSTTITTLQAESSSSDMTNISVTSASTNFFSLKYDLGAGLNNNFNSFTVDGDSEL